MDNQIPPNNYSLQNLYGADICGGTNVQGTLYVYFKYAVVMLEGR